LKKDGTWMIVEPHLHRRRRSIRGIGGLGTNVMTYAPPGRSGPKLAAFGVKLGALNHYVQ
jgi:hypothetical protein